MASPPARSPKWLRKLWWQARRSQHHRVFPGMSLHPLFPLEGLLTFPETAQLARARNQPPPTTTSPPPPRHAPVVEAAPNRHSDAKPATTARSAPTTAPKEPQPHDQPPRQPEEHRRVPRVQDGDALQRRVTGVTIRPRPRGCQIPYVRFGCRGRRSTFSSLPGEISTVRKDHLPERNDP